MNLFYSCHEFILQLSWCLSIFNKRRFYSSCKPHSVLQKSLYIQGNIHSPLQVRVGSPDVPDCPGQFRNGKKCPASRQVHFGTMKRHGMKFSWAHFADFAIKLLKNQKVKIYLQQNKYAYAAKISTEFVKIELLTQLNIDRSMDTNRFQSQR